MFLGLSWNGRQGQIRQGELTADLREKPVLGFDFDGLVHDPEVGMFFKFAQGENKALDESEKKACEAFVTRELFNADYDVYVHRLDFIFERVMDHKEARALGLDYVMTPPDHPASRYNPEREEWERIVAVTDEAGVLTLYPDRAIEATFGLFLTEEEWAKHPQPEGFPGPVRWSYSESKWSDARNLAEEKFNMSGDLSARIETRANLMFGRSISTYDVCQWSGNPDKREFMRYTMLLDRFARLRNKYMAQIEAAESLPDLDAVVESYRKSLSGDLPELDLEASVKAFMAVIQLRLDNFAQSRCYDDARSCVATYRNCGNATFAKEAEYMQDAIVRTWEFANAYLNAVLGGQRTLCAWEDFEAELAVAVPLVWPVEDTRTAVNG